MNGQESGPRRYRVALWTLLKKPGKQFKWLLCRAAGASLVDLPCRGFWNSTSVSPYEEATA
jgi:hypothetical protein